MFAKAALFTAAILASAASAAPHRPHSGPFKPPFRSGSSTATAPPQQTSAAAQMMVSSNQTCGSGASSAVYCECCAPPSPLFVIKCINHCSHDKRAYWQLHCRKCNQLGWHCRKYISGCRISERLNISRRKLPMRFILEAKGLPDKWQRRGLMHSFRRIQLKSAEA